MKTDWEELLRDKKEVEDAITALLALQHGDHEESEIYFAKVRLRKANDRLSRHARTTPL